LVPIAFGHFICKRSRNKKAMGAWKPPMAFLFNSNTYSGVGQTPSSFFTQHHQFIFFKNIIFSLSVNGFKIIHFLTNEKRFVKKFFLTVVMPHSSGELHRNPVRIPKKTYSGNISLSLNQENDRSYKRRIIDSESYPYYQKNIRLIRF
jgi:hypothetical protein